MATLFMIFFRLTSPITCGQVARPLPHSDDGQYVGKGRDTGPTGEWVCYKALLFHIDFVNPSNHFMVTSYFICADGSGANSFSLWSIL